MFPHATCLGPNCFRPRTKCGQQKAGDPRTSNHLTSLLTAACSRGLALMSVSSLCLIHSESFHGFCHFHLNCNSHWWWLLFHLHSFPDCPRTANFFIDNCPMGTICNNRNSLTRRRGKTSKFLKLKEQEINLSCLIHEWGRALNRAISNACCVFYLFMCWHRNWR